MKIPRDLTVAGFAKHQVDLTIKKVNKLKREIELLKNDRLRKSQQNFKIRRKSK